MSTDHTSDAPHPVAPNRAIRRARVRKLGALGSGAILASGAAAGAVALSATPAGAAPPVTNTNDTGAGSLRDALANANDGDVIDLTGLTGQITLSSAQLDIDDAVTIVGPGAAALTISGGDVHRIFDIDSTLTGPVSISGLTLAEGDGTAEANDGNGGALYAASSVVLSDLVVTDNYGAYGAGVFLTGGADLTVTDSAFVKNVTVVTDRANDGGAIYAVDQGDVTISSSSFVGNVSTDDEAGAMWFCNDNEAAQSVTITDSQISGNTAESGHGGGIFSICAGAGDSFLIANSTITGNTAGNEGYGGGLSLFYYDGATVTVAQNTITGNTADGQGGGVYVGNRTVGAGGALLTGNIVFGNIANGNVNDNAVGAETVNPNGRGGVRSADVNAAAAGPDDVASEAATLRAEFNIIGTVAPPLTLTGSGNQLGVDPLVGALADNGGPTQTQALQAGSPAINAGPSPVFAFPGNEFDQRGPGYARVSSGRVDVGAYELQALEIVPRFTG